MNMTLEQANHRILGDRVATGFTMRQGLRWAYAAAVAAAKTTDDPEAYKGLRGEMDSQKTIDASLTGASTI
jgi:hypothetical protein